MGPKVPLRDIAGAGLSKSTAGLKNSSEKDSMRPPREAEDSSVTTLQHGCDMLPWVKCELLTNKTAEMFIEVSERDSSGHV